MRIWSTLVVVCALVLGACDQQSTLLTEVNSADAPFSADLGAQQNTEAEGTYLILAKNNKLAAVEAEVEALGGAVTFSHAGVGLAVATGLSEAAAADLNASTNVTDVAADEVFQLDEPEGMETTDASISSPSDPTTANWFPAQWNMRAIDAPTAWAAGHTGSSDVTVAILDTGIDYTYPDLQGRVDLSRSISFLPADDALVATYFPAKHPITDLHYHGTHVASTVVSNGNIFAGVTSQTTLMGVKVCSVYGGCPGSAIFPGILHAADNGADVINMSLGGAFLQAGAQGYGAFLNKIFHYADQQGATVVVAAGNSAADLDRNYYPNQDGELTHFPSLYATYCDTPSTICVSATGPTSGGTFTAGPWTEVDAPAVYTNYGRSTINVAAPGGNVGASVIGACSQTTLISGLGVCRSQVIILGLGGTSMATPHVAGLASLIVADEGRNPNRVKILLQQSADDLGQNGTDPFYGKGRINVAKALGL